MTTEQDKTTELPVERQHAAVTPPPQADLKKRHLGVGKKISLIVLLFIVSLGGGSLGAWLMVHGVNPTTVISRQSGSDGNALKSQNEQSIAQVASDVSPSVVSIITNTGSRTSQSSGQAAGTGMIVSKDGYVMTNKHVISDASSVTVTASSGEVYDNVKIIGSDPLNDVAFLKINGVNDLKPVTMGESSTVRTGQNVVAIGNSLGEYQNTVTSGIISGLNRPVSAQSEDGSSAESLTDLIQTDAAINPGNSGGPLVNLAGQVVGINTAVASDAQGIGFAIPINATKGVLDGVLKNGKIERGYLGLHYVDITPALAKARSLASKRGALVLADGSSSAVVSGGPADKAGIKDGDIITKIGDLVVGQNGSVSSLVGEYKPGDTIDVTISRGGKEQTVKVTIAQYDAPAEQTSSTRSTQNSQQFDPSSLFNF